MSAPDTDILADLVRAKRSCLIQLRDAGRRQLELIDGGNMTALLDLLAAKQRTIVQLQRVERALDPFRGQDPDARRWRTPQDRAACCEQLQQCETLLGEIISQEKCSESNLTRRRDVAAVRLQGAHLAGVARGAYTAQPQTNVSQLDLLSER
jgi:hypothetical protein